jgi:hypothetical protein
LCRTSADNTPPRLTASSTLVITQELGCATANNFMASSMAPAWMLAGITSEVSMRKFA